MPLRVRLRWALAGVSLGLLFVAGAWLTLRTGTGARLDDEVRNTVLNTIGERVRQDLSTLARPLVIVVLGPVVGLLVLLALVRGAWRRALAAIIVPVTSTALTLWLRQEDPFETGQSAFPSNHAALGLGLLVAVMLVWPTRVGRWGLFAGAIAALCIGLGNVSWYAHQPRDVVGSALLVGAVTASVIALLGGDTANLAADVGPRDPSED
ncbi:phosphatase PAP2 family protein [Humibacillus xanthopallidus]|uniref:phosphatase PAP2 family protein n=1 Tax=Humibacillus xanthopallidus TaxID=412689 RepID=UPI00384EB653